MEALECLEQNEGEPVLGSYVFAVFARVFGLMGNSP